MRLDSLNDVLTGQISDLYSAERQLVGALPKVAQAASDPGLRSAIEEHFEQTRGHVARLDRIVGELHMTPPATTCEAMKGLLKEGEEIAHADGSGPARDAALIAAAQRVEHYEIAAYGTAKTLAGQLGLDEVKDLLQETLDEEAAANDKLTKLATGGMFASGINDAAAGR